MDKTLYILENYDGIEFIFTNMDEVKKLANDENYTETISSSVTSYTLNGNQYKQDEWLGHLRDYKEEN